MSWFCWCSSTYGAMSMRKGASPGAMNDISVAGGGYGDVAKIFAWASPMPRSVAGSEYCRVRLKSKEKKEKSQHFA